MSNITHLLHQLMRTFKRHSMRRFIVFSKDRGLSMSQIGTLLMLHRRGLCNVSDISDYMGISTAAGSQLLNQLVDEQLIMRQEDPDDRRVRQIVLTDAGKTVAEDSMREHENWLAQLTSSLTTEEEVVVTEALNLLLAQANKISEFEKSPTQEDLTVQETV